MSASFAERAFFAAFVGVGTLCAITQQPVPRTAPTALVAKTPSQHLKKIPLSSKANATFELMAKRASRIIAVHTSCNCTAAALNDRDLEAGECAKLEVEWNLAAKEGDQSTAIAITYLDEPDNPQGEKIERLFLQLQATAVKQVPEAPTRYADGRGS